MIAISAAISWVTANSLQHAHAVKWNMPKTARPHRQYVVCKNRQVYTVGRPKEGLWNTEYLDLCSGLELASYRVTVMLLGSFGPLCALLSCCISGRQNKKESPISTHNKHMLAKAQIATQLQHVSNVVRNKWCFHFVAVRGGYLSCARNGLPYEALFRERSDLTYLWRHLLNLITGKGWKLTMSR